VKLVAPVAGSDVPVADSGVLVADSDVGLAIDSGDAAGLGAGATDSVFCSQAASSAAPAKIQMCFFIR
jgi:hypothetical protein